MSSILSIQTEIEKLSFLLKINANALSFMQNNDLADIQYLRQSVHDRLLLDNSDVWAKLAAVAKFMPNFFNAQIARTILGPQITANFTYHIEVSQALAIAKHFNTEFLSDVAENLIPERAQDIIRAFSPEELRRIAKHMLSQKKYFTMGAFVDHLPQETLSMLAREISDAEALLRIAIYTQNKSNLAGLLAGFTDDQVLEMVSKAEELKLWSEILAIIEHFNEQEQKRIAKLTERFQEQEIISMLSEAHHLELLNHVVNFMRYLSETAQKKLAKLISNMETQVILGLLKSAEALHELNLILIIIRYAEDDDMPQLAGLADELTDPEILAIIHASKEHNLIKDMLRLASYFSEQSNTRFCQLLDNMTDSEIIAIITEAHENAMLAVLLRILEYATEAHLKRLAQLASQLDNDILLGILKEAAFQEIDIRKSVLNLASYADEDTKQRYRTIMQSLPADVKSEAEKVARNADMYERVKFLF